MTRRRGRTDGSGRRASDWQPVAGDGTDPEVLARAVALSVDADSRRAVQAAVAGDGLLDRSEALAPGLLPTPTAAQWSVAARVLERWTALGVRVVLRGDPGWPERLERLDAPPAWLGWRGRGGLPTGPAVAIVGARRATPYGTGVAAWLSEAAGQSGATVVSGGAVGIDAAAHQAAVDHATTVVLGCGHDVAYPRPHARRGGLFERVLAGGGSMVSELLPSTAPKPWNVRARNRIVAGLVDVVVVVEGGSSSGSLVTATDAADAGVDVMAVPGDVRAPGSAAPHRLLCEGAVPCTGPDDLLAALRTSVAAGRAPDERGTGLSVLPDEVVRVLAAAWPRPLRTDQIADRAQLGIGVVLAAVTRGRVAGAVAETAEGVRLTRAPMTDGG